MIDLKPEHLIIVQNILKKHIPFAEVRAFGSRVVGNAKAHSDLDLAVVGEKKLDRRIFAELKSDFEESDLPFRIDLLDWHAITEKFQKLILKKYQVIQKNTPVLSRNVI